jgi:microcystin degradation protein MlrC
MSRIALAGFIHETNTFSKTPTPLESFINQGGFYPAMMEGEAISTFRNNPVNIASSGFLDTIEPFGHQVIPLLWVGAEPSAQASAEVFEYLMGKILSALEAVMPVDGVYLDLHGAMVYEDYNDAETEILERIRRTVGDDLPVVASLDLHGNITRRCFDLASALVGYRTYPHVDGYETGQRSAVLMDYLLQEKPLFKTFHKMPFLMPSTTQPTTRDPAKAIYALIDDAEALPDVRSATIMEGFPPCDIPETGPSVFAYAETIQGADQAASLLYDGIMEREEEFQCDLFSPAEAVSRAVRLSETVSGPVILADIQDNVGGGSPSDSVWILEELIRQDTGGAALGLLVDPEAAAAAHLAGEGAEITIDLGGKSLEGHKPFHGTFKVVRLFDGDFEGTGPMVKGRTLNLGKMAQLMVDDIRIVVITDRMQALDQSFFRVVGIEPAEMKILVLKSANHYRADFGPISGEIINVEAPSAIIEDPSKIPYHNLRHGVRLKGLGPQHPVKTL